MYIGAHLWVYECKQITAPIYIQTLFIFIQEKVQCPFLMTIYTQWKIDYVQENKPLNFEKNGFDSISNMLTQKHEDLNDR